MKSLQIVGNARYGGATYLMLEWSKFLVEKGVEVDVVCTDPIMINKSKEVPGIRVIDNIYMPREIKPFTDLKAFYQLITLMRRKRYDVVHTYTAVPSFLGRFASRLSGMPVCVNHQGGWSVGEDSSLIERLFFTPLEYAATLACTKNICVSHAEKAKALDLGLAPTHKLVTIVNGIDPQRFVTARQNQNRAAYLAALDVPEDHLIIGNTGRLVPGKGNEELIESIGLLLKRSELNGRPVTLLLAGDGVDRPKIEALIDSLNLKDHIRLLGFWNDVPGLLANI
ncbi:MAG: glycosyltransferase, partial [Chloroflexota bacterium]